MSEPRGGVVFRVAGELFFLPASIAMKVLPIPEMARVPGGPPELRGVALVEGSMIPVIDVDERANAVPKGAMLVCAAFGERLGLVGIEVVATGRFEDTDAGVMVGAEMARAFDLERLAARVREGRWGV
jgi:chemotaxis signal transduction protein